MYSEEPARVVAHDDAGNLKELAWVLDKMRAALEKPTLTEKDFHP